jgi:hypothetical protein
MLAVYKVSAAAVQLVDSTRVLYMQTPVHSTQHRALVRPNTGTVPCQL